MSTHRLEACIQHGGMNAEAGLLSPDGGWHRDLGQQCGALSGGVHPRESGE